MQIEICKYKGELLLGKYPVNCAGETSYTIELEWLMEDRIDKDLFNLDSHHTIATCRHDMTYGVSQIYAPQQSNLPLRPTPSSKDTRA